MTDNRSVDNEGQVGRDEPLVSVIIPCYNGEEYIGEAIASVKSQTYANWELIVVDDASQDNSKEILTRKANRCRRVKIVKHRRNRGISSARNSGIRRAKGEFVAFLDQDDLWNEEKLEKSVRAAKRLKNPGLIHTGLTKIDSGDGTRQKVEKSGYSSISDKKLMVDLFRGKKPFYTASTVMVNYKCFERLGLMDKRLKRWDDKEMWIRILSDSSFETHCIEETLTKKRTRDGQASADKEVVRDQIRLHNIVLQKHPSLRRFGDSHMATIYFRYAKRSWSEGFSWKYIDDTVINFAKSAYMDPKRWKPYVYLILSLGGKHTYIGLNKIDEYLL